MTSEERQGRGCYDSAHILTGTVDACQATLLAIPACRDRPRGGRPSPVARGRVACEAVLRRFIYRGIVP